MDITIRPERVSDYNAIANLNYDAFGGARPADYKAEATMPSVLRHSESYDPDLAIVAETDGEIVGHASFSPFTFVVMGERRTGVYLAPLSVKPQLQRKGIGGMLLNHGHAVAREKGHALALLCGHERYYPKFGYRNRFFAFKGSKLTLCAEGRASEGIAERPVKSEDLAWIIPKWWELHKDDRLAWFPGASISQWLSHSPMYRSSVVERDGKPLGFIKYRASDPLDANVLLPMGSEAETVAMLGHILRTRFELNEGEIRFTSHCGAMRSLLGDAPIEPCILTNVHAMLKVLDEKDAALLAYCDQVKEGDENLGILAFPAVLDIDE